MHRVRMAMGFHMTEGVRWLYGPVGFPHHCGDLEDLVLSPHQQSEIERQFEIDGRDIVRSILPTTPTPSTAIPQVCQTSARPRARPWLPGHRPPPPCIA